MFYFLIILEYFNLPFGKVSTIFLAIHVKIRLLSEIRKVRQSFSEHLDCTWVCGVEH